MFNFLQQLLHGFLYEYAFCLSTIWLVRAQWQLTKSGSRLVPPAWPPGTIDYVKTQVASRSTARCSRLVPWQFARFAFFFFFCRVVRYAR